MVDEVLTRRPEFDEANSVRVELADAQEWAFPKPWVEMRPRFEEGKAVAHTRFISYGLATDTILDLLAVTDDTDTIMSAVAGLAAVQLRLNYDLTEEQLDQLLAFRSSNPRSMDWVRRSVEIAIGEYGCRHAAQNPD